MEFSLQYGIYFYKWNLTFHSSFYDFPELLFTAEMRIYCAFTAQYTYSERQKYFDIHYKASGKMRTDLQRKLMLRIANPTQ